MFSIIQVIFKPMPADWHMQGGIENPDADRVVTDDDGKTFFYQKFYNPELGRFEDPPIEKVCDVLVIYVNHCLASWINNKSTWILILIMKISLSVF